ncbi:SRPBCC family protein [Flagellimonas lutaonensis]|uniref:Activator of Hsp90 ATPase 1 family protein n=1 Tax=Flagellimonas lutaonensis TaxID=516051 RepID=A0A0D5YQB1_9FLAO|nr:SRPBCC domain-containing protein [Allomuricauda lutaonensis]AKA34099.1 Activator of Hsp90 ATPase 1 family protein [Allomuricauda lutaonensis]
MKTTDPPIIIEKNIEVSKDQLWKALTDPGQMRQWFFENIPDFRPVVGFETEFPVVSDGKTFTHLWQVTEAKPHEKISYRWRYAEYGGDSVVHFQINGSGDDCQLQLTLEILKAFPQDIAEFKRESGIAGWNYFLDRLKIYLEAS